MVGAIFQFISFFVSHFLGEAETYVFPISGWRPEMGSVPGNQDCNTSEKKMVHIMSAPLLWARNDYTHILIVWNSISNCTGHLLHRVFWQELSCVIRVPPQGTFCERQFHKSSLGIKFFNCTHICYA